MEWQIFVMIVRYNTIFSNKNVIFIDSQCRVKHHATLFYSNGFCILLHVHRGARLVWNRTVNTWSTCDKRHVAKMCRFIRALLYIVYTSGINMGSSIFCTGQPISGILADTDPSESSCCTRTAISEKCYYSWVETITENVAYFTCIINLKWNILQQSLIYLRKTHYLIRTIL